jgi:hypothetical protein
MLRLANPSSSGVGTWMGSAPLLSRGAPSRQEDEAALIVTGLQASQRSSARH